MKTEEMKKPSESPSPPSPTSFSSLPYDIVLNCLARISRIHHPSLSLVSKTFRSILASSDLDATRFRIGKTENRLYVCLDLKTPRWLTLSPIPYQQKLIQIPSFPYQNSKSSTVISTGSEIYVIGGIVKDKRRSKKVFLLDCKSHQWRRIPNMRVPRKEPAADVIDGKIYVIGGCNKSEDWGEVYDPKTQTWELLLSSTEFDLSVHKSLVPGKLVMCGKVYDMNLNPYLNQICLVEIENVLCQTMVYLGFLIWYDSRDWKRVDGLEGLQNSYLTSITSFGDGRRVTVWWKSSECETEIWCAEISFERRGLGKLWGIVEWSKNVFTLEDGSYDSDFFWHYATVTH